MCYLVTGNEDDFDAVGVKEPREYQTLADARKYAEYIALNGVREVRIFVLTHSVEVQPQAVWKEHARGLSNGD